MYCEVGVIQKFAGGKFLLQHFSSKHRMEGVLAVNAGGVGHFLIEGEEVI